MSGTGGGGIGSGRRPREGAEVDCATLFVRTVLSSPKPAVVSTLRPDDVLRLVLRGDEGPLEAVTDAGAVAGSITAPELLDLIRCIGEGYEYVAIVQDVRGGRCEVQVRPVDRG